MYVLSMRVEIHIPEARSLKQKRAVVKPLVDGVRRRHHVAAAEVDHLDKWQRTAIGVAVVASSHRQAQEIIDEVERYVWSWPSIEIMATDRTWLEAS